MWSVDKITAKSGSIGAWNIDEDSIYAGIKQTSDTYSTSGITLSSNGSLRSKQFIIKADGSAIFKGELSAATGTFSGALSAATGTFKGSLSAATGTFAGSLSAATGTFSGQLVAATGTFSGKVTASGGEIGGWIIASDALYTGTKWNGTSNWTNGITTSKSAIVTYT